jgi:hypothetical protein
MKEMLEALSSGVTHLTAAAVTQGMMQEEVNPMSSRDSSSSTRAAVGWLLLPVAADVRAVATDHSTRPNNRTLSSKQTNYLQKKHHCSGEMH